MPIRDSLLFYNPWWVTGRVPEELAPPYRRAALKRLLDYLKTGKVTVLKGPRQTGKTTLAYQAIGELLRRGAAASSILYVNFEEQALVQEGLEGILDFFEAEVFKSPLREKPSYCVLDEVQYLEGWSDKVKKYHDRKFPLRFLVLGSSATLIRKGGESLAGRTLEETVLPFSFREFFDYHAGTRVEPLPLEEARRLLEPAVGGRHRERARILFQEYLLKGGMPNLFGAAPFWQKVLREQVIEKAIYKDLSTLYGVTKPKALEDMFLYLARTTATPVNLSKIAAAVGLSREFTALYLGYLKNAYLLFTTPQEGTKALRHPEKVHVMDPGIANAVLGRTALEEVETGPLVESCVARHFLGDASWWSNGREVDLLVRQGRLTVPIEVKYQSRVTRQDLDDLLELCRRKRLGRAILITRDTLERQTHGQTEVLLIPAWLFLLQTAGAE